MKKKWVSRIVILFLVLTVYIGYKFYTSVDINDIESLSSYIANHKFVNSDSIKILKTASNANLFCVLYEDENDERLFILEKEFPFINRYKYRGAAKSTHYIDTYRFGPVKGESLIIVYGTNKHFNAYSYELTKREETYYVKTDLEDYILDIYFIPNSEKAFINATLKDKNGNKIVDIN